jgi:hypothetical protein
MFYNFLNNQTLHFHSTLTHPADKLNKSLTDQQHYFRN